MCFVKLTHLGFSYFSQHPQELETYCFLGKLRVYLNHTSPRTDALRKISSATWVTIKPLEGSILDRYLEGLRSVSRLRQFSGLDRQQRDQLQLPIGSLKTSVLLYLSCFSNRHITSVRSLHQAVPQFSSYRIFFFNNSHLKYRVVSAQLVAY